MIALPPFRTPRSTALARLGRARDRLRETLDQRLTIPEVAREARLSSYQFIRTFKAAFGETPHQVRIHARLELARRMLILGEAPITEICDAAGFASLGTFSHVFAQRVGVSPSAFRKQARAQVQVAADLECVFYPGCLTLMARWPVTPHPVAPTRNFQEAARADF